MEKVTVEKVIENVRAVAKARPDVVYPVMAENDCFYSTSNDPDNVPRCIIGESIYMIDPGYLDALVSFDTRPDGPPNASRVVSLLVGSDVDCEESGLEWLNRVQLCQDDGFTWSEAVTAADRTLSFSQFLDLLCDNKEYLK